MAALLDIYRQYHLTRDTRVELAIKRAEKMVEDLLNHCPDMECVDCSRIVCKHKDPMHFHHDGCPSCAEAVGEDFK